MFIFISGEADGPGEVAGICMPGIFSIFPGEAAGEAVGIGMFISIFCCGEAWGFGEAAGICMPGMFICICCGEACDWGDGFDDEEGSAGMFMPGMLPIWFLFAEFFRAGALFRLDASLRRGIPGIFIPGMLISGMLPMPCFIAVCFFRVVFLFRDVVFDLDFAFGLLIPGILDISCCENAVWPIANDKLKAANKIKSLYCENILFMIFSTLLDDAGAS